MLPDAATLAELSAMSMVRRAPGEVGMLVFMIEAMDQSSTLGRLPQFALKSEKPFALSVGLSKYQSAPLPVANRSGTVLLFRIGELEKVESCSSRRPCWRRRTLTRCLI